METMKIDFSPRVFKNEALIHFKHKSVKEYWGSKNFTTNKVLIKYDTDLEWMAEEKVEEILDLLYPDRNMGSGYDTLYEYKIIKIDKNPYNKNV